MKKYEGLFILNTAGKEETIKEAIDKISAEIESAGGKVGAVQKMEKKNFSRVANKKHSSGFYVNVLFESQPAAVSHLKSRFAVINDAFRVLISAAPTPKAAAKTAN